MKDRTTCSLEFIFPKSELIGFLSIEISLFTFLVTTDLFVLISNSLFALLIYRAFFFKFIFYSIFPFFLPSLERMVFFISFLPLPSDLAFIFLSFHCFCLKFK